MPRRRLKTRIELLAESLAEAKEIQERLKLVDMRRTNGPLRDALRAAREANEMAVRQLERAVLVEEPPAIGQGRAAAPTRVVSTG